MVVILKTLFQRMTLKNLRGIVDELLRHLIANGMGHPWMPYGVVYYIVLVFTSQTNKIIK